MRRSRACDERYTLGLLRMAQDHLDTLSAVDASFLHQEGANTHMHIGGIALLEGPPPAVRRPARPHPLAPAPRAALPAEARRGAVRPRPLALDRRPVVQPRVPRAPHRAAGAGQRGEAPHARRAHVRPAPGSHQAAVGAVARRGPGRRPLGDRLQDPPLPRRRRLGRRPDDDAVRPHARGPGRRRRVLAPAPRADRRAADGELAQRHRPPAGRAAAARRRRGRPARHGARPRPRGGRGPRARSRGRGSTRRPTRR